MPWKRLFNPVTAQVGVVEDEQPEPGRRRLRKVRLRRPPRHTPPPQYNKSELAECYATWLENQSGRGIAAEVVDKSFLYRAPGHSRDRLHLLPVVKRAGRWNFTIKPELRTTFRDCYFEGLSFAELSLEETSFLKGEIRKCLFGWTEWLVKDFMLARHSRPAMSGCRFECPVEDTEFVNIDILDTRFTKELVAVRFNDIGRDSLERIERARIGEGTRFSGIRSSHFKHATFSKVVFDRGLHHVRFSGCEFTDEVSWPRAVRNVRFENCVFDGLTIEGVHFENCQFVDCKFLDCQCSQVYFDGDTKLRDVRFELCALVQTGFDAGVVRAGSLEAGVLGGGRGVELTSVTFERCRIDGPSFRGVVLEDVAFRQCEIHNVYMASTRIREGAGQVEFEQGCIRGMKYAGVGEQRRTGAALKPFRLLDCCFDNVVLSSIPYNAIGLAEEGRNLESYVCREEQLALAARKKGAERRGGSRAEAVAQASKQLDRAAKFYGQLYRICLEESHPVAAGEFFFRMMDAKRQASRGFRRARYVLGDLLCGYGERIGRVGYLAVAILLAWTFLFLWNGLWIDDQVISYGLIERSKIEAIENGEVDGLVLDEIELDDFVNDFSDALRLSANVFTNMGDSTIRQPNRLGSLLVSIESFLGIFVTALFVSVFFRKIAR